MKRATIKNDAAQWAGSLWRVAADCYSDRLHRFFLRRLGRQEADDVAQEVYVRLMHVKHNEFIRNPEAYIFTVARQVVGEFGRRAKRQRSRISTDSEQVTRVTENPDEICPDELAQAVSTSQFLQSFLEKLPPEQAAALLLYERDGYSYAEIARILDVSERAVQRYLIKARERLHEVLASEETDELSTSTPKPGRHNEGR
jgi:RNA polymerase sigma-70 factor (ECF subfamily)